MLAEETCLPMPELPSQSGTERPQEEALLNLEGTLAEWVSAIQAALSLEAERTIAGRGMRLPAMIFPTAACCCGDKSSSLPDTCKNTWPSLPTSQQSQGWRFKWGVVLKPPSVLATAHCVGALGEMGVAGPIRGAEEPAETVGLAACADCGIWCRSQKVHVTLKSLSAGALDEMGFWQARFEVLGSLQTQLDTSHARSIIAMLRMYSTDRNLLGSFKSHFGELSRVRPVHSTWLNR